jgi:hypothetical protein
MSFHFQVSLVSRAPLLSPYIDSIAQFSVSYGSAITFLQYLVIVALVGWWGKI